MCLLSRIGTIDNIVPILSMSVLSLVPRPLSEKISERGLGTRLVGTVVAADVYRIVHVLLLASLDVDLYAGGE